MIQLLHGDCLERMKELPDCSIDACVTDPPYGLSFMAKAWDYEVPSVEIWQECFRVLKPGGHLLAFAGTRTQHRMAVNIEDAGFEIRDMIAWVYGSGFPKSHNLKDEWEGWGTALKPALEPITVARKPFKGTVAANVLEHGTGALNIDGCRVPAPDNQGKVWIRGGAGVNARSGFKAAQAEPQLNGTTESVAPHEAGRWPANLIHDGSDEVVGLFPDVKGQVGMKKDQGGFRFIAGDTHSAQSFTRGRTDSGSAARFFYCAKASKKDRDDGNTHPTVKPTDLMRYLCRLVTPPGGTVLDPFMGSGSTGKAAVLEGFNFIGIEREIEYLEIARERIKKPAQGSLL